jgi:KRAB domain-containing zinc finger protein
VLGLRKHQKSHSQPQFTCLTCSKSFSHKYTLEQHQAVHTEERKFKCKVCSFSTKYNSHLAAHRRTHEGNVHHCTFEGCQYWSAKFTLLKAHLRAHNGDKCFKCDQCGKGFVEAGQLRRHTKTHSVAKPFPCLEDGCGYATNRRDKLKEHQARTHKEAVVESSNPPTSKHQPSKLVVSMLQQAEVPTRDQSVFSPSEVPYVKEEILGY